MKYKIYTFLIPHDHILLYSFICFLRGRLSLPVTIDAISVTIDAVIVIRDAIYVTTDAIVVTTDTIDAISVVWMHCWRCWVPPSLVQTALLYYIALLHSATVLLSYTER